MKDKDFNKSVAIVGLGFGDEGKGSCLNYLYQNLDSNKYYIFEKYNGGCQGRHTVRLNNGKSFSFSQLSPSILSADNILLLSDNFVFEPFALFNEIDALSFLMNENKNFYFNRIYIDKNAICVTPIHKYFNIAQEEFMGDKARGSVGTGVSIAKFYSENSNINSDKYQVFDLVVKANDLHNISVLKKKLRNQKDYFSEMGKLLGYDISRIENFEYLKYIEDLEFLFSNYFLNIIDIKEFYHNDNNRFVFESSQGILLDRKYGVKPNITYLDTSCDSVKEDSHKIGVIRSIYTRHGVGVFPTEDEYLEKIFNDESQEVGQFSGKLRFGWFDLILYKYALRCAKVNEVYMTCLDYLRYLNEINICIGYKYNGDINQDFKRIFEYENNNDAVIIKEIKCNDELLSEYLNNVTPIYDIIDLKGCTFTEIINKYVAYIMKNSDVRIGYISYGSNINNVEVLA